MVQCGALEVDRSPALRILLSTREVLVNEVRYPENEIPGLQDRSV